MSGIIYIYIYTYIHTYIYIRSKPASGDKCAPGDTSQEGIFTEGGVITFKSISINRLGQNTISYKFENNATCLELL